MTGRSQGSLPLSSSLSYQGVARSIQSFSNTVNDSSQEQKQASYFHKIILFFTNILSRCLPLPNLSLDSRDLFSRKYPGGIFNSVTTLPRMPYTPPKHWKPPTASPKTAPAPAHWSLLTWKPTRQPTEAHWHLKQAQRWRRTCSETWFLRRKRGKILPEPQISHYPKPVMMWWCQSPGGLLEGLSEIICA